MAVGLLLCLLMTGAWLSTGCGDDAGAVGTTGSIEGRVTLAGQSDHQGALISLVGSPATATTGPSGGFRVPEVVPGSYELSVSRAGYQSATVPGVVVEAGKVFTLADLELQPVVAGLSGVARREGATDHAGITVRLTGTAQEVQTDATGAFAFASVAPGTYVVTAEAQGYASATSPPVVVDAQGSPVDVGVLTLAVGRGGLEGTATLEGRTEHGGILMSLQGTEHATLTGPSGRYAFSGVPAGQYGVVASFAGFASASANDQTVEVGLVTSVPPLVLASDPGTITGVATLEGATGFAGIVVSIPGTSHTAVTVADGSFTLSGVAAGTYVVAATRAGYDPAQTAPFVLAAGGTHDVGAIALSVARGSLTGSATLEGETDHSGILVSLQGTAYATMTGPTGAYAFSGVPVGQYTVEATRTGFAAAAVADQTVLAGQTTTAPALLLARNPGTVTGIVRYEDQTDHAGILVTLNNSPYSGATDSTGRFTVTGVAAGPYSASAQAAGYARYDFPVVIVHAGQSTDLGESALARLRGRIEGVVELLGASSHGGVLLELVGTGYHTYSGLDGRWALEVPIGNYPQGVRASLTHWSDATHAATITVEEIGVASVPLLELHPVSNAVNGHVLLFGQPSHEGVTVELTGVDGTDTAGLFYSLVTTDPQGTFTFDEVAIGPYDVTYAKLPEWPTLRRYAEVPPGDAVELPTETLQSRFVRINDDEPATRLPAVTLTLHSSDCYQMRVGNQADLSAVPWSACAATLPWSLTGPDGWSYVYAQFQDSQLAVSEVVYDRIWLDSTAVVTSVTEDTGGLARKRGDVIRFTLAASGETNGAATIDVAGYLSGIPLFDDGTHGDAAAGDGVYTTDHTVEGSIDVQNAEVTGHFTDAYGNSATGTAPGTVTLANPPRILNVQVVPDSASGTATISWETDELASGRLDWGLTDLYGDVEEETAHTTTKSFILSGLVQSTPYHFRITATDVQGNIAMTVDRVFYLRPSPPEVVIGMPGDGRFDVRWEAPPQANVIGYHVYRSVDGGPRTRVTTTPYTSDALVFHDEGAPNGTPREYWVTAVDEFGNESEDAPPVSGTPGAPPPAGTTVSGILTGTQVWTTKGGPYHITGHTLVEPGGLLVIGPGTQVLFEGNYFLRMQGQLVTVGAPGAQVELDSGPSNPAPGLWNTIELQSEGVVDRLDLERERYLGGNLIYRTRIRRAGATAIRVIGTHLAVIDSTLSQNVGGQFFRGGPYSSDGVAAGALGSLDGRLLLLRLSVVENSSSLGSSNGANTTVASGGLAATNSSIVATDCVLSDNQRSGTGFSVGVLYSAGLALYSGSSRFRRLSYERQSGQISSAWIVAGPIAVSGLHEFIDSVVTNNQSTTDSSYGSFLLYGGRYINCDISDNAILSTSTYTQTHLSKFSELIGSRLWNNEVTEFLSYYASMTGCEAWANTMSAYATAAYGLSYSSLRWSYLHDNSMTGTLLPNQNSGLVLVGNTLLDTPTDRYVSTALGTSPPDVDISGNCWAPALTAEMEASGPSANITGFWDYRDDFDLLRIQYAPWGVSAYPLARIDTPRWGLRFRQGEAISFTGHADDPEDGAIPGGSLHWSSSVDGALGTGSSLDVSTLSLGHHEIWLTGTDSNGQEGKVYTEVEVVDP